MLQTQSTMESEPLTTADLANLANGRNPEKPEGPEDRGTREQNSGSLLTPDCLDGMRTRWETIQTGFVDDPKIAVREADELVATAIQKLVESFAQERAKLEQEWSKGNDVSTEDLRQALRRYRSFFHRLLSI